MANKTQVLVDSFIKVVFRRQPAPEYPNFYSVEDALWWRKNWVKVIMDTISSIRPLDHLLAFQVVPEYEDRCSACNQAYEEWIDPEDEVPGQRHCAYCGELIVGEA